MPDDDWFDNIDPLTRLWMYESWCQDLYEKNEFSRNYSILVGSFSNLEMAQKMLKVGQQTFTSSDEDFEESTRWMINDREKYLKSTKNIRASKQRKLRRKILNKE